jgi:putative transposase
VSEKFAFIDAEKAGYPVVKMCVWLGVSTSGYYEWVDRPRPRPRPGGASA